MTENLGPAKAVFLEAVERHDPDQWPAFLDRACAGRPDLRGHVEALLAAHREVGTVQYLDPGEASDPGPVAVPPPQTERPGAVFGPYKLVEQVGEGGMGAVWMAQQTDPVRRLVAVKLIKAGMDSSVVLARFEAERQALALMDHPNIARVLDAGKSAGGRPYFVMELVKGVPITRYCDDNRLTTRQRLDLFATVCRAVQHAHQKGVIHRDIKPSNVLVALYDGKPVPKVIDFGVAKAAGQPLTDRTLVTGFGAIVGTPEYMSPEQAEFNQLDVDTRSDVYSLGVLLYELLTGAPPFPRRGAGAGGLLETLRAIREQEPTRPSKKLSTAGGLPALAASRGTEPRKLCGLLRGDLDWVVMKALEKDRGRRYETASGLAEDVRRHLADEPVQACPPSPWYRFRKFARRNRPHLALGAALGLLLAGAGAFAWHADRQAAERRAEAGRREQEEQARLGRNAEAASLLLDQCEEALRADRADRAAIALQAAAGRAADGTTAELTDRLSRLRADLGLLVALNDVDAFRWTWTDRGLPTPAAADARLRAALATYGVTPDAGRAAEAAGRVNGSLLRAQLLTALDLALAHAPSAGVREVLRAADPDPYRDAVRDAIAAGDQQQVVALAGRPDALAQPPGFVIVLTSLGGLPADRRVAVLKGAVRRVPGNYALLMAIGNSVPPVGPLTAAERVRWFQAAVAANPGSAVAHNSLAFALKDRGDGEGAVAALREAVRLDPSYTHARNNLGLALRRTDPDGAIAQLREAIRIDPTFATAHSNLGRVLSQTGDRAGALAAHRAALRADPGYAMAHNNLAWLLAVGPGGVSDGKEAVSHATKACELTDWKRPDCIDTLAAAYAAAGDFDRAVEFQTRALTTPGFEQTDGPGGRDRLQLYRRRMPYKDPPSAPRTTTPPPPGP